MKIIFLDIDGVLNRGSTVEKTPAGFVGIDKELIEKLSKFVKKTKSRVVLTSSWKSMWENNEADQRKVNDIDAPYLIKTFKDNNIKIFDKTIDSDFDRGKGNQ